MQLGRYQILKQLAAGSVADVLLARAGGLEGFARHVVLKRIRPELAAEKRFADAFLAEARIAASLHHHNIVQVHDIGEHEGSYFFAMEYVHGEDVRKLIHQVRQRHEMIPLEHALAIVTATAAGLHHAHEAVSPSGDKLNVVHRDVSPANILIGYDGSVKLVDFGLAKAAQRTTGTGTATLKGKTSYMSPEQCTGRKVDRRSDVFSLGIVLYELVTTERLFKGVNEFMTMAAIVDGVIPKPSSLRSDIPASLDEIILRALARAPEARYQTAEALRESLEQFAVAQQLRTSPKALADYLIGLFGERPEPWQVDERAAPDAPDFESTYTRGLVDTPTTGEEQVLARHAPEAASPMMRAKRESRHGLADASEHDEHEPTVGGTPRAMQRRGDHQDTVKAKVLPRSTGADDDAGSTTQVEAPIFDPAIADEVPSTSFRGRADDDDGLDEDEPATEIALTEPVHEPEPVSKIPPALRPLGKMNLPRRDPTPAVVPAAPAAAPVRTASQPGMQSPPPLARASTQPGLQPPAPLARASSPPASQPPVPAAQPYTAPGLGPAGAPGAPSALAGTGEAFLGANASELSIDLTGRSRRRVVMIAASCVAAVTLVALAVRSCREPPRPASVVPADATEAATPAPPPSDAGSVDAAVPDKKLPPRKRPAKKP